MYFRLLLLSLLLVSCNQFIEKKEIKSNYFLNYGKKDNKELYLDSIYNLLKKKPNDSLSRELMLELAIYYAELDLDEKFKVSLQEVHNLANKQKDTIHKAHVYWYLGDYYDNKQVVDSAYYYYLRAEKLYESQQDSLNWGRMLSYKGGILYDLGIYSESEIATALALQVLSGQNDTQLIYESNVQMSLVLKELKEYNVIRPYYSKISQLLHQLENEGYDKYQLQRSWLSYYNNMGVYYQEIKQPLQAKPYFQTALINDHIDSFPRLKAMLLNNYAYNQMLLYDNSQLIDSLLQSSLRIREQINHKQGIVASQMRIAEFHLMKKDTLNAIATMKEVYAMALEAKNGYELIASLKFLGEHDGANKEMYTAIYLKTQDSLQLLERQTRNKFARIAYETEEIEKENTLLVQRNTYLGGIIILVTLLFFVFFILVGLRLKNKRLLYEQKDQQAIQQIQTLLLQQQTLTNETKNQERQRIAKDLHDSIINRVFTLRINLGQLSTTQSEEKEKLLDQLKQVETQTRALSHDMHDALFSQEQNFGLILMDLVHTQKNSFQTVFECSVDQLIHWEVFTIAQKAQVYLILQEVLQNVNKHAQATKCFVIILLNESKICIRIHDNGIGIGTKQVEKGLGFKNIKYRIQLLNGSMAVSIVNQMTTINLEIPYNK